MQTDELSVQTIREALGESQTRFGERFGVDQTTVHRWEKNGLPARGAARHAVEKLATELGMLGA